MTINLSPGDIFLIVEGRVVSQWHSDDFKEFNALLEFAITQLEGLEDNLFESASIKYKKPRKLIFIGRLLE